MMVDYYLVLGVLPEAEHIVIVAAYRALAQRYHPDKWKGDPKQVHERMSAINEAYRILGDAQLRQEYDRQRTASEQASYQGSENEEADQAFDSALRELEGRWSVAVGIFADLAEIRKSLAKISSSLAFTFVTILLETKNFNSRKVLAENLERQFLQRFFGTDPEILKYAKELILMGHREAAKMLNQLVDVMGSQLAAQLLIDKVEGRFDLRRNKEKKARVENIRRRIELSGSTTDICELAAELGFEIKEQHAGFLGFQTKVFMTYPDGSTCQMSSWEATFEKLLEYSDQG